MKVLKMNFGLVDVFQRDGWENWTRVRKVRTKNGSKIIHISGARLTRHQMNQLERMI